jgi:uncharacterized protein
MNRRVLYLHGFASSPQSSKARWIAQRLKPFGITLRCPDFNRPDFASLTVTRMIDDVISELEALGDGPAALFGSSLGALVAYHSAARTTRIDRLILLAPAFEFARSLVRELGDEMMRRWKDEGSIELFHYGYNAPGRVGYGLYEDALQYDPFATQLDIPIVIFQGLRDRSVRPADVERFASTHANVTLHMLDDDHQLLASLDDIWRECVPLLKIES